MLNIWKNVKGDIIASVPFIHFALGHIEKWTSCRPEDMASVFLSQWSLIIFLNLFLFCLFFFYVIICNKQPLSEGHRSHGDNVRGSIWVPCSTSRSTQGAWEIHLTLSTSFLCSLPPLRPPHFTLPLLHLLSPLLIIHVFALPGVRHLVLFSL